MNHKSNPYTFRIYVYMLYKFGREFEPQKFLKELAFSIKVLSNAIQKYNDLIKANPSLSQSFSLSNFNAHEADLNCCLLRH